MLPCTYCRRTDGSHNPDGCPGDLPNAEARYDAGWSDGRNGRAAVDVKDAAYMCGFRDGDSAADEASNGNPWSW